MNRGKIAVIMILATTGLIWANKAMSHNYYAELDNLSDDELAILTIAGEAGNQGPRGKIAVGEVIRNRMRKGKATARDVILKPKQFSLWNNPITANAILSRNNDRETLLEAESAWYQSAKSNITRGATHYHNSKLSNPYWRKKLKPLVRIQDHSFYLE